MERPRIFPHHEHCGERALGINIFLKPSDVENMEVTAQEHNLSLKEVFDLYIDRLYWLGTLAQNGETITIAHPGKNEEEDTNYGFELDMLKPNVEKITTNTEDKSPYLVYMSVAKFHNLKTFAASIKTDMTGLISRGLPLVQQIVEDLNHEGELMFDNPQVGLHAMDAAEFLHVA